MGLAHPPSLTPTLSQIPASACSQLPVPASTVSPTITQPSDHAASSAQAHPISNLHHVVHRQGSARQSTLTKSRTSRREWESAQPPASASGVIGVCRPVGTYEAVWRPSDRALPLPSHCWPRCPPKITEFEPYHLPSWAVTERRAASGRRLWDVQPPASDSGLQAWRSSQRVLRGVNDKQAGCSRDMEGLLTSNISSATADTSSSFSGSSHSSACDRLHDVCDTPPISNSQRRFSDRPNAVPGPSSAPRSGSRRMATGLVTSSDSAKAVEHPPLSQCGRPPQTSRLVHGVKRSGSKLGAGGHAKAGDQSVSSKTACGSDRWH